MENLTSAGSQENEASTDGTPPCGTDSSTEDSDADSEIDMPHGMIRPTLLKQLQVILDNYPDDAQIIRELVQNAEDAGASEMRIYHDKRHTVLPENNDFAKYFRAPALCVYNNAKFTQQDWEGIVTIYDSTKQSDALKVGRFGLGFKSVFHMTDHPVIISDNRLLIIDPCKRENECIPKSFKNIMKDSSVSSALQPVLGNFGFSLECILKRSYEGTLFWFPLREQKSDLSDNLYSNEKMESLITLFIDESSITLLFLRNMRKMFIHTEKDNANHSSFSVQHDLEDEYNECLQQFQADIQGFRQTLPTQNKSCVFRSSMKVMHKDEVVSTEKWTISSLYKGKTDMSNVLEILTADKSLSYCPLVSIAVLTSTSTKINPRKPWLGHVFCFLPLPLQSESLTGLPVHLNGFFSLSDNRRQVNWPSSNNEANNDKKIQWNQRLCEEVFVDAYVNVVDSLKEITTQDGKTDPSENLVYKALPRIDLVHSNWSIILDPLYKALFCKDTFYTENDNGKWIPISESIFSIFDWTPSNQNNAKMVEDDVLEVLSIYNKNVVQVPDHVEDALMKYYPKFQKICPSFVRQILKTDDRYKQVNKLRQKHLLEFVISDVETNTNDLENLELLPLKNGSFTSFSNDSNAQRIYLCTEEEYAMFPKLEYKFADFEIAPEWLEKIHHLVTQDHPVIISDNRLLIIDPCKRENECIPKSFKNIMKDSSVSSALQPVLGNFGFSLECILKRSYEGTLFWFPLREQKSDLSDNLYSNEKMESLITLFIDESSITLLFLRNMRKMFIHTEKDNANHSSFSVQHDLEDEYNECLQQFQADIQGFRQTLPTQNKSCVFRSSMKVMHKDEVVSTEKWTISSLYKGKTDMSNVLEILTADKSLSYCPLVSIAVLTSTSTKINPRKPWLGHVFCFLPLPLQSESLTGLPVHLNGFFSLSDNRRQVNWPSSNNEANNDKKIQWNQRLCEEVFVDAYVNVVDSLKEITTQDGKTDPSENLVYKALPRIDLVHSNWSIILDPLYKALFCKDTFYTENDNGKWIPISESIFSIFDWTPSNQNNAKMVEDDVLEVLSIYNKNVVQVPDHVEDALMKYYPKFQKICPSFVRQILKTDDRYKQVNKLRQKHLLEFVISDVETNTNDLENLELLPLKNGSFTSFSNDSNAQRIYLCTEEEYAMFPKLEYKFADFEIAPEWLEKIHHLVTQGFFQLRSFRKEFFPELLKEMLELNSDTDPSGAFVNSEIISSALLKKIWEYLNINFENLNDFELLHIIPVEGDHRQKLLRLKGFYVLKAAPGMKTLTNGVQEALSAMSVTIIENISEAIVHPKLRGTYCRFPTVSNILQLLREIYIQHNFSGHANLLYDFTNKFNETCSVRTKTKFRKYISEEAVSLSVESKEILKELKIFVQNFNDQTAEDTLVSIKENRYVACKEPFPFPFPKPYLVIDTTLTLQLAQQLGAIQTTSEEVVKETLLDIIQNRSNHHTTTFIQKFMKYFIQQLSAFQNALDLAKQISFVTSGSGRVLRPDELFDSEDECLKELFSVLPERFPCEEFRNQHILYGLKLLGLKNRSDISHDDIITIAKSIHFLQMENSQMEEIYISAIKLLEFLKDDSNRVVQHSLLSSLGNFRWVPFINRKPTYYPDNLPWFGSSTSKRLCFPHEARNLDFISVAGSVMCLVDVDKKSNIGNAFNWNRSPGLEFVIKQIKVIINNYKKDEELALQGILKSVYINFNNSDLTQLKTLLKDIPFVFSQCGFCHPSEVFINFPDNLDEFYIKPFMYRLPEEFRGMQNMFIFLGCHESLDATILIDVLRKVSNKHQSKIASKEVGKDRKLVISILQTLTEIFSGDYDLSQVLVPISGDPSLLIMKPASECTYDDYSQKNDDFTVDEDKDFKADIYVHPDISASLAVSLGIPSLTKRFMTDNDATEMIADWGQSEPLTTRLSNLLEGYSDGCSILKELIQNAEDAGASEIHFMYDERENENLKSKVIENMAECQGPAFWAFNNAVFEEKDFENIIKLGGRTKEKDRYKIGKFGLGFCSVYNLTDVPSFISKNTMIILDPHTLYLGKAISNKRNQGIRINFGTTSILKRYKNQFETYNNVFGCKLSTEHFPPDFRGTLFRFPLRTKKQATVSDIKKLHYNKQEMLKLLQIFESSIGDMLLFTQNLKSVSLWHLKENTMDPKSATLILKANKNTIDTIPLELKCFSAIKRAGCLLDERNANVSEDLKMLQQISIEVTQFRNSLMHDDYETNMKFQTNWLVSWSSGGHAAIQKAVTLKEKGALALGSVALPLSLTDGVLFPTLISSLPSNFCKQSHIFCFLPLPEICSLPVHINGCFAIESDRKRIYRDTGDDKSSADSEWNTTLLTEAICDAYLYMLEYLNHDAGKHSKKYSTFWPNFKKRKDDIQELTEAFYQKIVKNNPCIFNNGFQIASFKDCLYLESSLRHDGSIGEIAYEFLFKFYDGPCVVMDMTEDVYCQFMEFGCHEHLKEHTISILEFYRTLVLPNLKKMTDHTKELNALLTFALENHESLMMLLKDSNCIPTLQSDLVVFKKPKDLVKPKSKVSKLFSEKEGRFPLDAFCSEHILDILIKLGMMHDSIPTDLIVERALSVEQLSDGDAQVKRCSYILKYLQSQSVLNNELLKQLSSIKFLPVLEKSASWPIHWKGNEWHSPDSTKSLQLNEPQNLYLLESQYLIGCIKGIVDSEKLSLGKTDILKQLGVSDNEDIKCQDVVQQLRSIADVADKINEFKPLELNQLGKITNEVYKFIENKFPLSQFECNHLRCLETEHILFLNNKLIRPDKTTFDNGNILQTNLFEPEIYHLDKAMKCNFENFLQGVGVPLIFEKTHITKIITRVQKEWENQILSVDQIRLISNLLLLLSDFIQSTDQTLTENERENILVPDDQSRLRRSHDVCIDDGYTKLQKLDYMHFINDIITPAVQKMLRIRSKRQTHLSKIADSIAFGQKEELVTRIKNILETYPIWSVILNEMLQNADDAGASEIQFVLDMRKHNKQHIFDDSWGNLQGPALCVFNDTCFSDEDLKGIANIGIGSKSNNPTQTGQFGIGFNAVYHITDAPSFISRGDATPKGGTFCVFDPHCNYCPIATEDEPGMIISDLNELEREYPDVYMCYLQTIIQRTCGTWFRLPLRTNSMARDSKISNKVTTESDIKEMFQSFKSNMLKSLLFLQNVKKISLSCIDESNPEKLEIIYEVESHITEQDQGKLRVFFQSFRQFDFFFEGRAGLFG